MDLDLELANLENLQLDLVVDALKAALATPADLPEGFCNCRVCLVDIVALALNSLPPRYVADRYYKFPESEEGSERKNDMARRAVSMALRRVSRRPHHDR